MNDTMTIRRSCEEGMYLLREGDCLWRMNEDGRVDCTARGHTHVFEFLTFLQLWKTPACRPFPKYPLQNLSD